MFSLLIKIDCNKLHKGNYNFSPLRYNQNEWLYEVFSFHKFVDGLALNILSDYNQ